MTATDSIQKHLEQIRRERQAARAALNQLAREKITLRRPVFFIPGWTDEANKCWLAGYAKNDIILADWIQSHATNPVLAHFLTFTLGESEDCDSFLDFAALVKERIAAAIGKNEPCDLVGHSMGGLDAVAAITDESAPLRGVHYLITVATPHRGSLAARLRKFVDTAIDRWPEHHDRQANNMIPGSPAIRKLNTKKARATLLKNVYEFYSLMGSRDQAVLSSPKFDTRDLDPQLVAEKYQLAEITGVAHSQHTGITQDPRTILNILRILTEQHLARRVRDYGYIIRRA